MAINKLFKLPFVQHHWIDFEICALKISSAAREYRGENNEGYVKEGCNRGHGLSAAIKLGTPEPRFLQSGPKLTCSQ